MITRKSEDTVIRELRRSELEQPPVDYRWLAAAFHPINMDEAVKKWAEKFQLTEITAKHHKDCKCSYCVSSEAVLHPHNSQYTGRYDRLNPDGVCVQPDELVSPPRTLSEQRQLFQECFEKDSQRELPEMKQDRDCPETIIKMWWKLLEDNPAIAGIHEEECEVEEEDEKEAPKLKGLIVFYVEIGNIPPEKVESVIDRTKTNMAPILNRVPEEWGVIFTPSKVGEARTEVIKFG